MIPTIKKPKPKHKEQLKVVFVRVPEGLLDAIKLQAFTRKVSINKWAIEAFESAVKK